MKKKIGVCPKTLALHAVEQFCECPGMQALFFHAAKGGEIHCTTYGSRNDVEVGGEKKTYYIPRQKIFTYVSGGPKYAIAEVSVLPNQEPEFSLVVCTSNRHGYLIPKKVLPVQQKIAA